MEQIDPHALMAGQLGQWLSGQDTARAEAKAKASRIQMMSIAAAAAVAFVTVVISADGIGSALKFGFFIGAAGFAYAHWTTRAVINSIKGGINGAIAKTLGMEYSVEHQPGAEFENAKAYDMLPNYERASFEDLWRGRIGEQSFQLYEAKLEEERNSGKHSRWETVFEGSIISVEFARRFQGVTLIERAGRRKRLFGLLGEKDEVKLAGHILRRINVIDPQFSEQFAVWSNDPAEGHYLVHPHYVERLVAVEQSFAGHDLRALFHGGELLIVLESGNMFESGSLEASEDQQRLEQSIQQFGTLADLAEKLNERTRPGFGSGALSSGGSGTPPSQTA